MATISIADNDARVQYTQAVTANTTQLTIDFPFFSLDDINVIVTSSAGVDTTLTRGTGTGTFAVTGTSVDDGFSGGHVTLGDTYSDSSTKYTIFRDITVERTTDFPTSGPFNVSSLNTELDKIFAIEQELETKLGRTMKLADSDTAASLTLPNVDTRKGTVLAFNATSGLPEAGPSIASVGTVAANVANINTVAGISANVTTVAGISANVTTVAGISSNVTTVAGIASNVTSVAGNATNINTVAGIASDITAVAAISSDIQVVENNIAAIQGASGNATTATTKAAEAAASATEAEAWAQKTDGEAQTGEGYSAKAWATGGTGVTDSSGAGSAKEWATDTSNTCDGTEYSAKEYAIGTQSGNTNGSAKQWALGGGAGFSSNTAVSGSQYSAKYWAEQAAASASDFNNKYLGPQSSDPTQDPDGSALDAGDLYYNTSSTILRVYNGSAWEDAVVSTSGFATAGFSIAMSIAL